MNAPSATGSAAQAAAMMAFQAVSCPLCDGNDKETVAENLPASHHPDNPERFSFSRCRTCSMVFLDPLPANLASYCEGTNYHHATGRPASAYRMFYRLLLHRLFLDYPPPVAPWLAEPLRALLRGRWAWYETEHHHALLPWRGEKRGRLLDVGAGGGDRAVKFARLGWKVTGVEMSTEAARAARERHRLDVRAGMLEDQHFPNALFDAVTLMSVLEHIPKPISVLREIHRLLCPGGVLFLDVPNFESRQREIFGPCWTQYSPPQHVILPTETTLRRLLESAGFRVEYVRFHCSAGLYMKACKRARKLGTLDPALPEDDAGIQRFFETECAGNRGELMLALASKS